MAAATISANLEYGLPTDGRGSGAGAGSSAGSSIGLSIGGSSVAASSHAPSHVDTRADDELLTCCICSSRLVDPLLLGCLHSCCRRCADTDGSVKCPSCDPLTAARSAKPNAFLASCLAAEVAAEGFVGSASGYERPPCDACLLLRDAVPAAAIGGRSFGAASTSVAAATLSSHWCTDCCKFLCEGCVRWHDKFNASHTVMSSSAAEAAASPPPWALCEEHGRPLDLLCLDCNVLRCKGGCYRSCIEEGHQLCPTSGKQASDAINKTLASFRCSLQSLAYQEEAVRQLMLLPGMLATSRGRDLSRLQANKKRALDVIATAHHAVTARSRAKREAAVDVNGGVSIAPPPHGGMGMKSPATEVDLGRVANDRPPCSPCDSDGSGSLGVMRRRLRHAAAYVERLLHDGDALDALDQLPIVKARLSALDEQVRQVVSVTHQPHPTDSSSQQQQPPAEQRCDQLRIDLEDALCRWIGQPIPWQQQASQGPHNDRLPSNEESYQTVPANTIAASAAADRSETTNEVVAGDGLSQQPQQPELSGGANSGGAVPKVLSVGEAVDSFRVPYDCRDVAVTADGRVLLAALRHGLKHYTIDGHKLTTWRPSNDGGGIAPGQAGIVSTVDALHDGRVLVGVINFQCVFILRPQPLPGSSGSRNGVRPGVSELLQLDRIDLHVPPYRLAASCASSSSIVLAVVGAANKERSKFGGAVVVGSTWSPGPMLRVFSLAAAAGATSADGNARVDQELRPPVLDMQLGYDALSVAVTSHAVVTVSNDRVSRPAGGGQASAFVVEARATVASDDGRVRVGDLHWRRDVYEDVYDLCTAPQPAFGSDGQVLYAALPRSVKVMALSTKDGRSLSDAVVSRSRHAIVSPLRASIAVRRDGSTDGGGGEAWWLVLLAAGGTVIIYPATGRSR